VRLELERAARDAGRLVEVLGEERAKRDERQFLSPRVDDELRHGGGGLRRESRRRPESDGGRFRLGRLAARRQWWGRWFRGFGAGTGAGGLGSSARAVTGGVAGLGAVTAGAGADTGAGGLGSSARAVTGGVAGLGAVTAGAGADTGAGGLGSSARAVTGGVAGL